MNKNVPQKTISSTKNFLPWINSKTQKLIKKKKRLFAHTKSKKTSKSKKRYDEIKKVAQRRCRNAHQSYVNDLITTDKSNKKFWAYVKSQRNEHFGISDLIVNSRPIKTAAQKANALKDQFSKVFSNPQEQTNFAPPPKATERQLPRIKITKNGTHKLLSQVNEHKAPGPDGIPGRLLKTCADELAETFTILFQSSLDTGIIPQDWKKAHIVPIYKKGSKHSPENYRPISLTSIPSKILEHIVHSNIMTHLDTNNLITPLQHGFRKGRSCETQLITTANDFAQTLNSKSQTDAILLDFSKAFDKVDHKILLTKASSLGIGPLMTKWIHSFLNNRTQTVLVEGSKSDPSPVLSGVPQGTVLGPLLFLIYINDISSDLTPGTSIRLFADDSLLYRQIHSKADQTILQKDLNTLQAWEANNKMEFHPDKCQVIQITNKTKHRLNQTYNIHNTPLQFTNAAKYLGITIDNKLNFNTHISAITRKANSTLSFISRNFNKCPQKTKEHCVRALVHPLLNYGSSIWDPHTQCNIDKIEKVNKRAARFITGNYIFEHGQSEKNLSQLNWPTLQQQRFQHKVTLLFKIHRNIIHVPSTDLQPAPRNPLDFAIPQSTIEPHLHSFFPSTIRLWNTLPPDTKTAPSLPSFSSALQKNLPLQPPFKYIH